MTDFDRLIENIKRDLHHADRKATGKTPWPTSKEQQLIDTFGMFATEEELDTW